MIALLIAAGAAVGAPLRYLIDRGIQARFGTLFPWGTLVANVCACLVLGLITGTATAVSPPEVYALIGTGLCGALSTLSTFSYQALRFAEEGFCLFALAYVAGTVVAGLGGAAAGVAIAHATWALASRGCCRCRPVAVSASVTISRSQAHITLPRDMHDSSHSGIRRLRCPAGLVLWRTASISGIAASSATMQNATSPPAETSIRTPITTLPATQAVP